MRNCTIREANNGWVLEVDHYQEYFVPTCSKEESLTRGPYVFSDW